MASGFPGDQTAEINLVPVNRVVAGILAALTVPEAIGHRIHLATDNRIRSDDMVRIIREELGANVRLSDPTLYRNLTLPIVKGVLEKLGEPKLGSALEKLGTIFGAYGEWGQPIHDVGNDVRILGLPIRRPAHASTRSACSAATTATCRSTAACATRDEVARREQAWGKAVDDIELRTGHEVGAIPPEDFRRLLAEEIDLKTVPPAGAAGKEHPRDREAGACSTSCGPGARSSSPRWRTS